MDKNKLKDILDKHLKWLKGEDGGERANLRGANLRGANLHGANPSDADLRYADLSCADLSCANLSDADLSCANLHGANLCYADLRDADLSCANLSDADLRCADLSCANLHGANPCYADLRYANLSDADLRCADLSCADLSCADLSCANLHGADLRYANLHGANLSDADLRRADLHGADLRSAKNVDKIIWDINTAFFTLQCPESGAYTAYKKAGGLIVELEIPADALRSSATSRKCRASKAKVISITDIYGNPAGEQVKSDYNRNFVYAVGQTVEVQNFDENRWEECAPGIHHFITRDEAVKYS